MRFVREKLPNNYLVTSVRGPGLVNVVNCRCYVIFRRKKNRELYRGAE